MTDPTGIGGGAVPLPPRVPLDLTPEERAEAAASLSPGLDVEGAESWPWYEARLSVHVRSDKPTDAFGEGGEELAHARSSTQAPSFPDAVARLDSELAQRWEQITANAALVDQEPSPDVLPKPAPWWRSTVEVPLVLLVLALLVSIAQSVVLLFG